MTTDQLHDMTDRELYRLAFDISEVLVERARVHLAASARATRERLEYLRGELRAERMSWGELAELQSLSDAIDPADVELLEAAGVPEHSSVGGIHPGWSVKV